MDSIKTKTARMKLAPRPGVYWETVSKGRSLGFRRGPDTWHARLYTPNGARAHEYQPLTDLPADADYSAAKVAAEAWFAQHTGTARRAPTRGTVREALDAYLADLRSHGRESTAKENEDRFKLIVDGDPIAAMRLEMVTRDDFEAWRDRLRKGRQPRSINRHVRGVAAALNRATAQLGHVGNPAAWTLTALTDDTEDAGEAATFLTDEQRARLIARAGKPLAAFLRGLEHTGARPSELAAATVSDFDVAGGTLILRHRKGRPARLKARAVTLSTEGAAFFKAQTRSKLPAAPLVSNPDGAPWRRHEWSREIRAAISEANAKAKPKQQIPVEASAYSFRHARISELLQVYSVDPLTVAAQTGTSIAMMEKYYFKFLPNSLKEKLDRVKGAKS